MPGDVGMAQRIKSEVPGVVGAAPVYIKMNM